MTSQEQLIGNTPIPSSLGTTITGAIDTLSGSSDNSVTVPLDNWIFSNNQELTKTISEIYTLNWKEAYLNICVNDSGIVLAPLHYRRLPGYNTYESTSQSIHTFVGGNSFVLHIRITVQLTNNVWLAFYNTSSWKMKVISMTFIL